MLKLHPLVLISFLAAPATEISVFAAQALDGCGGQIVSLSSDKPVIASALSIFPNPANESFTVLLGNDLQNATLLLYNIDGKHQNVAVQNISNTEVKIKCNNLSKGIYLLKIYNKNKTEVKKIVIL